MSDSGMVLVKESFLNELLLKSMPPPNQSINQPVTKSQLNSDELDYFEEIDDLINQHINIATEWLESDEAQELFNESSKMKKSFDIRYFFNTIESEIDEIVNSKATSVDDMIARFYNVGNKFGFKQIKREIVFSPADANSLFNIQNYNFNLIRNISNDLKSAIRENIWRSVAQGESAYNTARRLRDLPLEPLNKKQSIMSRAMSIARTETMRAKNTGCLQAYKNYGVDKVYVPGIGDGHECPRCLAIVNNGPYTINEASLILPAHPNCRHHFAPYMDALIDPVELDSSDFVDMTINIYN